MLPRPRFRLPLWAATVVVAVAYVGRSVLRGMDFRPDWPSDAVVLGLFLLVVAMVAYVRRVVTREDSQDDPSDDNEGPATP
ncbi:MAG TPA: hypothetical protein VIL41_07165 [Coriobacteriia bacterium]